MRLVSGGRLRLNFSCVYQFSANRRLAFVGERSSAVGVHQDALPWQVNPYQAIFPVLVARQAGGRVVALQSVTTALPIERDSMRIARIALDFDALAEFAAIDAAGQLKIQLLVLGRLAVGTSCAGNRRRRCARGQHRR